jgi:tetratricopeptide (TPR) repeat protein
MGLRSEAIQHFELALRARPDNVDAHNNLGLLLAGQGDTRAALSHFQRAAHLRPDLPDIQNCLGDLLRQMGRPQDSIEHFEIALRLDPNFAAAWSNYAKALAALQRSQEAIVAAQQGINVANAHGQTDMAAKIQDWLQDYGKEKGRGLQNSKTTP